MLALAPLLADEQWMRVALAEAAQAAAEGEIPIGAVVVYAGRILGRGRNQTETLRDVTAHAEMLALTAAAQTVGNKYLPPGTTLYCTVEPCPMCAGALYWSQVMRIVYGAADEKRGMHCFSPTLLHPRAEVCSGVLGEECASRMKDFFASRRR